MRGHEQFGRPPHLRPRSAGVSHASPRSLTPEQLAQEASNGENAALLRVRLQAPRPGPAAAPRSAVNALQPTMLLSKPPMRPKSAAMGVNGSRGVVSQHRMDCIKHVGRSNNQEVAVPPSSDSSSPLQQPKMVTQLERAAKITSGEEDHISNPTSASDTTSSTSRCRNSLKRPFSAAPSLGINDQSRDSSSSSSEQPKVQLRQPNEHSRAKRPFSAAPVPHARNSSVSKSPFHITADGSLAKASPSEAHSRSQSIGISNTAMAIMKTFHRDTFVYAVPKHCLERGRQYNPYDIVIVAHECLFGSDHSARMSRDALYDYYTISATGMTFHCKDDNYEPSFLSSDEWERQKSNFTAICKLATFQLFRYRKAFFGWKKWIRSRKIENARSVLSSSLYFAQPLLIDGMKKIHQELQLLESIDLMSDPEGITHHLSQFSSKNSDHIQRQGVEILKITGRIQQTLLDACRECLDRTENPFGGYPGHQFALSRRRSNNFHIFEAYVERELALATADQHLIQHDHFQSKSTSGSQVKMSPPKAGSLRMSHRKHLEHQVKARQRHPQDALDEIRWTMAAIQRRRCLLLAKFVALVDFMTVDALHGILTRSIQMIRDTLWAGANVVPISRLLDRRDYVQAFHKVLLSRHDSDESLTPSCIDSRHEKGNSKSFCTLNKQQAKRILRSTWESKMTGLVRAQKMGNSSESLGVANNDRTEQLRASAAVWLESRLDSFFFHSLAERHGVDADVYTFDDILLVIERDLSQALVLPDFNSAENDIKTPAISTSASLSEPEAAIKSVGAALQEIESLAPIPLFHMSIALHVYPSSRKCDVTFTPTLDRISCVINETLSSFIELFGGIPAIVTHQELRAVLAFAEDYRAPSIGQSSVVQDESDSQPNEEGDDDNVSRWNKSNYDRLYARINTDNYCTMLRIDIEELIASTVSGIQAFVKKYDEPLATYSRNESINFDELRPRFQRQEYSLKEMEVDARNFCLQIQELEKLKDMQMIEFIQLDTIHLKEALKPSPAKCLQQVHALYPALAMERCELFLSFVRSACGRIEKPHGFTNLEAFTQYLLNIHEVQDHAQDKEFDLAFLQDMFRMLERLEIAIPPDIAQTFDLCEPEFESLKAQLTESMARKDADIRDYSPLLHEQLKTLNNGIERLKTSSGEQAVNSGENKSHEARELANTLEKQAEQLTKQSTRLVWVQRVFTEFSSGGRPPLEEFSDLHALSSELKLKNELWEAVNDVENYLEGKQDETLRDIDLGQLRDILSKVDVVIKRLHDSRMQISAVKRLEQCKEVLKGLSPVIRDLRNENLEDRHWTKLEHKINCSFVRLTEVNSPGAPDDSNEPLAPDVGEGNLDGASKQTKEVRFLDLPLRHLLEVGAVSHSGIIHQVAEEATAEAAIAKSFLSVAQTWEIREIPSHAKKDREGRDAVCLGDCTEIITLLEESEVLLRVMESSSYARVINSRLFKLLQDLAVTKETTGLLTACQQKWEYLQRLISVDFVRSFPEQSKLLQQHDASWKTIMEGISKRPLCLPFGTNVENRQLLQAILTGFESAARFLDQHLEMKRQSFPGFYKLSNAELGTLLSKVRDINNIQQFLYQCFDNVGRINFGTREACQDILSITSRSFPYTENIQMGKNLKARGPPEQWLVAVERRLTEMLRKGTKDAVTLLSQASAPGINPFDVSTLSAIPLQSIILADRILRCELMESSLTIEDDMNQAVAIHAKLCQYGKSVCDRLIGGAARDGTLIKFLSTRDILLLSALRLHEIEFRDAINEHFAPLSADGARNGGLGVQWQLQMKHRFDDSTTVGYDCHVELDGMRVSYGFNYVNVNTELVFTPRTMRYVFSILTAARHAQAVMMNGVESAGKHSIALQISRHFGRRFFGLGTSETATSSSGYYHVAHCLKLLRGALHSGGILYIALPKHDEALGLLRILSSHLSQIEHSVLCKLPITCLQKAPINWIPGTSLLFAYRALSSSAPQWLRLRHDFDTAASVFCSVEVVPGHDVQPILEALAYSNSLEAPQRIAQKFALLWRHLAFVMAQHGLTNFFTMRTAKRVLSSVAKSMWIHTESFEREALQDYLLCERVLVLCRLYLGSDRQATCALLDSLDYIFQYREHEHEWYAKQWRRKMRSSKDEMTQKLQDFVDEAAQELQFLPRKLLVTSAVDIAKGLAVSTSVVLAGSSGTGKTTSYSVLASALDLWKADIVAQSQSLKMSSSQQPEAALSSGVQKNGPSESPTQTHGCGPSSFVTIRVILPTSLTMTQFIGSTATDAKGQINSLLGRLIREAQDSYALSTEHEIRLSTGTESSVVPPIFGPLLAFQKLSWIVFDGAHSCGGAWLDVLVSTLGHKFTFGMMDSCDNPSRDLVRFMDGEFMTLPPNVRFLFETWSLENATPAVLRESSIVVLKTEPELDIGKDDDSLPIYCAYIQRFIEQHRLVAMSETSASSWGDLSNVVYETVLNRLIGSDVLSKIYVMMEDYGIAVKLTMLERVEYLMSILQALLNTIAATCSSSRKNEGDSISGTVPEEDVRQRVEMAILYSVMWGFSACSSLCQDRTRSTALRHLISGILKSHFDMISHTWEDCGYECNLFDLLIDISGLRFVSLDGADTLILRDKIWRHSVAQSASMPGSISEQQFHSLFVPTTTSLIVHAAMKEAIRSARGVLLIGDDNSRKTMLLQNFLKQLDTLRILTTSNYTSTPQPTIASGDSHDTYTRRKRAVPLVRAPLFPNTDSTYASLDRIRLHQVGLVKRLAKRFRKVNKAAAALAAANRTFGAARFKNTSESNVDEAGKKTKTTKKDQGWMLPPHLTENKSGMVAKFDLGDFVPFYFAMNQHDRGVQELARCLERMLQRERSGVFEPPPGKTAVLIIDDLHLPVESNDEEHPSCHEYLRSVHEHALVLTPCTDTSTAATPITIENLMMVASIRPHVLTSQQGTHTKHGSLDKLVKRFLPVYAPPCSSMELHSIFHSLVVAHWERISTAPLEKLPSVVRQTLPIVVAATTILWTKMRHRASSSDDLNLMTTPTVFDLHDLCRVYAGMCAVEPTYILDSETMFRLLAHEVIRSFGDALGTQQARTWLRHDVLKIRVVLDELDHSQIQQIAKNGSSAATNVVASTPQNKLVTPTGTGDTNGGDQARATNLNTSRNATGLLTFFMNELMPAEKKSKSEHTVSAQQRLAYERKRLHVVGIWAFVPSSLYYQISLGGQPATSNATTSQSSQPSPLQRRNSVRFLRRKSMENVAAATDNGSSGSVMGGPSSGSSRTSSLGSSRWIYAEIPLTEDEDGTSEEELQAIQNLFSAIRVCGALTVNRSSKTPVTDLYLHIQLAQLPCNSPNVTPLLARNIAKVERVFSPPGCRIALFGVSGCGRELLLRYACISRQTTQQQCIWTVEGVPDESVMAKKWKHVVHQLFHRVGVGCEAVTLVVKRIQHWPKTLLGQLLALMVAGEIPDAFTLEEQIKLATRVRDERLIEMEQRHQAQITRIREEVEQQKETELLARKDELDSSQGRSKATTAALYQEIEKKYQHGLMLRLAQVQLRHQQELDDFLRKCEVENESVTATIMSLMRPLGMTSGKWQQIVQRMRRRLKIVLMVDSDEHPLVIKTAPQLLHLCNLATLSPLDIPSLSAALFGTYRAELQSAFNLERSGISRGSGSFVLNSVEDRADFVKFMHQAEHDLPRIVALAAHMHASAKALALRENREIATEQALIVPRFFTRILRFYYHKERELRRKAEWFSYVYTSMEKSLWKLQDRDGELQAQLVTCDQQIEVSQELLLEQQEDCNRIRDMMKRYQEAAEEQVQVTNEMEQRAQGELHVPLACLEEANAALLMIDKRHIIEIKSFNSPPLLVHLVLDAICVMFSLEPAWENARKILSDANVVHTLLTFDKDNISSEILTKLEMTYISDPRFQREEVEKQSVAASMMVVWVRAMYQYATARRQVMPTLEKLEQAQSRLRLLMQEFQVSKQRVIEADDALAKTRETLAKAQELRKETLDEMESRHTRLDGGKVVLEFLTEDKHEADKISQRLENERAFGLTWWNALLSAGAIAYSRHFDAPDRLHLFKEWSKGYQQIAAPARTVVEDECVPEVTPRFIPAISMGINMSGSETVAEDAGKHDEQHESMIIFDESHRYWEFASACGFFFSKRNLQDAFLLTQTAMAAFPVVLVTSFVREMEELLLKGARYLWKWPNYFMISAKAVDLEATLLTAVRDGHQLLILDVDPLDVEYQLGSLWWLFHWSSVPGEGEEGGEQLITGKDSEKQTSDSNVNNRVTVHPSFRAILATHQNGSLFGDSLLSQVPVIDAQQHTTEVADVILDKLWYPGLFEGGQHGFGLKQSVRDFDRLQRQYEEALTQLTKLIQGAAVRGEFQREETEVIQNASSVTHDARVAITAKKQEIRERIQVVLKHQMFARLGAAIYSAINGQSTLSVPEESHRLSFQMFLPIFLTALKKPVAGMSSGGIPMLTRRTSSSNPAPVLRSASRLVMLAQQHQQGTSRHHTTMGARGSGFDSISEILKKVLNQLMPLLQDANEWYKFLIHMLWFLERQYPVDDSPYAPALQAAATTLDSPTTRSQEPSVHRLLSMIKLSHWKSQAVCDDYIALPDDVQDPDKLVSLVVNGHAMNTCIENTSVGLSFVNAAQPSVFAASRCRAERVKTTLSMYPRLLRLLCDRILLVYGVQVRFAVSHQELVPDSSSIDGSSHGLLDDASLEGLKEAQANTGWLRLLRGLPEASFILIRSEHAFGFYQFLHRIFHATTATQDVRLALLKAVVSKVRRSSSDLDALFVIPNDRLGGGSADGRGFLSLSAGETALMIHELTQLTLMDRDKLEAFVEDTLVTIVNLQTVSHAPCQATHWEDMYHLMVLTPQGTASTELRRFEGGHLARLKRSNSTTSQQADGAGKSGGAIALISPSRPTARRFSTNLHHRRSDAAGVLSTTAPTPKFVGAINNTRTVPDHLRDTMVVFAAEPTELGTDRIPSFKQCIRETLVRFAYHPFGDMLRQILDAQSNSETAKLQGGGNPVETTAEFLSPLKMVWHYLTALVVYHSILTYRWQLTLRQYTVSSCTTSSSEQYLWDVLITALDQLLLLLGQCRATKSSQLRTKELLTRVKQQVFLSTYSRKTKSQYEVTVVRTLCREILWLVHDSIDTGGSEDVVSPPTPSSSSSFAMMANAPGITSSRNLRSQRLLRVNSSSSNPSAIATTSTPPLGLASFGASTRRAPGRRRSSLGDQTQSLLTDLKLPLGDLRGNVHELENWLDFMWKYAAQVDGAIENHLRDVFGLLTPVDTDLVSHPTSPSPAWVELFGWIRQPVRYGSIESQILVDDALQALQMIREKIMPPMIETEELSGGIDRSDESQSKTDCERKHEGGRTAAAGGDDDGDDGGDEVASVRTGATPSGSRSSLGSTMDYDSEVQSKSEKPDDSPALRPHLTLLHRHCVSSCIASYNRHVRLLQDFLDELVNRIVFWKTRHFQSPSSKVTGFVKSVSSIADLDLRQDILSMLCNDIPLRLRYQIAVSPTYLFASSDMTLDTLLAHHHRLFRNLSSHAWRPVQATVHSHLCEWWLPGVITSVSIDHLIELSKRSFSRHHGIPPDELDQKFEVAFSLRVDMENEFQKPDGHDPRTISIQKDGLDTTLTVFTGLELRIATWDVERCYLQTLGRASSREPQRVSVLCRLEKRSPLDLSSSNSIASPPRRRQLATRPCPLMTRAGVAYEFPLPIGPAFGSLVSPYLLFSSP